MATPEGYDPEVWRQLSEELALPGIHIPEQYGGAGFGMVELCIVMEELGRALLCAPYFSTAVLAANAILNAGTEAQKSSLLPDIASGARLATLGDHRAQWQLGSAARSSSSPLPMRTVTASMASKSYVVDGHVADLLVVAARVAEDYRPRGLGAVHSRREWPPVLNGVCWNRWIRRARSHASIFAARMRICSAIWMMAQQLLRVRSIRPPSRSPMKW